MSTGTISGFRVTEEILGAHPIHKHYPLLPGDLLVERADGTFGKLAPGLGIEGFVLTDEQRGTLGRYENQQVVIAGGLEALLVGAAL